MAKRACLCLLLLMAVGCDDNGDGRNTLTAPSTTSPVFVAIGPGSAKPLSATLGGQLITAPGSFLFNLPAGEGTYSIEGTFSHGALDVSFYGGADGLGGVTAGSVAVVQGPPGASIRPCGVGWALSGNAAAVGQKFEVRFAVSRKSSEACQ